MSSKASAYVTPLVRCPDGAALTSTMKLILFCLADHHNPSTGLCAPGLRLLARESLTCLKTVQRSLAYLEEHLVLTVNRPPRQGRGNVTTYTLLAIDAPDQLAELLVQPFEMQKGRHGDTLSRDEKGDIDDLERVTKGRHTVPRYKERTIEPNTEPTAAAAEPHIPEPQLDLSALLLLLQSNYKSATKEHAYLLFGRIRRRVWTITMDDVVALVFAKTQEMACQSNIRNPIGLLAAWAETIAEDDIEPARRWFEVSQRTALERKEAEEARADLFREYYAWEAEYIAAHPDVTSIALADIPTKFHPILGEIAAQRESEEGEQES